MNKNHDYQPRMRQLPDIDQNRFRDLRPVLFRKFNEDIKCIDFSECGNFALSGTKNFIQVYKIDDIAQQDIKIETRRHENYYGVAKFHKDFKLIHATKDNEIIRLDFEKNCYDTPFPASSTEVTSLSIMKDTINHFASSHTNCVKIWDFRNKNHAIWRLAKDNNPLVVCHPFKREIAIAYANAKGFWIEIYDYREKHYLDKFEIHNPFSYEWTELAWSEDGLKLMASTKNGVNVVIEASSGKILTELKGFDNLYNNAISACFTPCCNYAMSGSHNGRVHFWSLKSSTQSCVLYSQKLGPIYKVAFNPQAMSLATAGQGKFVVWVEKEQRLVKTERMN